MKAGGPLRRTGQLTRKTPLRARKVGLDGGGITRVKPIRPAPKRTLEQSLTWSELRLLVWERDDGHCVRCGTTLRWEAWECHHRRLRAQLGRDVLSNLIALCGPNGCHAWCHGNPTAAQLGGWIVVSGVGPLAMPVLYWDGSRRLLCDDGSYTLAA
jgi:hypothetical protein